MDLLWDPVVELYAKGGGWRIGDHFHRDDWKVQVPWDDELHPPEMISTISSVMRGRSPQLRKAVTVPDSVRERLLPYVIERSE